MEKLPAAAKIKYDAQREIARGKYGVVYACIAKDTVTPCAIKVMQKKANQRSDVMKEVEVLKKLTHPGILNMTEFLECEKDYVLVTEMLNGGELFDYVLEKDYLDEKEATYYMRQILEATSYFHRKEIVHLDLKPENVVLKDRESRIIKIIDFGTAQDLSITPRPSVMVGTPEFIAPEVLKFEPVTSAADMWAIGILTYVLLTGMSPFLGDDDMETINNISKGEFDYPDPDPEEGYEDISENAKNFIDDLIQMRPTDRTNADKCLAHEWMIQSGTKRIGTGRLKSFRARRRWLAVTRAARLSVSLSRIALLSSKRGSSASTDTCPVSPHSPGPDDAIGEDNLEA